MNLLQRARLENGLLAVLAVGLSLVLWLFPEHTNLDAERQAPRTRHVLPEYAEKQVVRLTVEHEGRETVLQRVSGVELAPTLEEVDSDDPSASGSTFRVVRPLETDADPAAVDRLLATLRYATWLRKAAPPSDAEPPLHQARLSVTLGEETTRLTLGPESVSPKGSHYVAIDPQEDSARRTWVVVDERLAHELFPAGESFRGRQIVPYSKRSIRKMTLSSPAGVRTIEREGGVYRFGSEQDSQRVERSALDRIFLALARASADPFVDVEVAKSALDVQSTVRVSLVPEDPELSEASLQFGGECPGQPQKALALRHLPEPLAGCVPRSVVEPLREPADVMLDRGLFTLNADEVDTLRIEEKGRTFEMVRRGDSFEMRSPEAAPLQAEPALDRLERILAIRGELLTGRSKPTGDRYFDAARITLESSAVPGQERVSETVALGSPLRGGLRWLRREDDQAVLQIAEEDALALQADTTLLKDLSIFDYKPSEVRAVEVKADTLAQRITRSERGGLDLQYPKGYDVDASLAVRLIDELRSLRAVRWVSDQSSEGFGLKKPRARVNVDVVVGDRELTRSLVIGAPAPGGYFAQVDRNPGVFVVPRALYDTLDTWLIDRSVFFVEREDIYEISVNIPNRGTALVRRIAGRLSLVKASLGFEPGDLDLLVDAVSSLRPEAAVHLGNAQRGEGIRRPQVVVVIKRRTLRAVGKPVLVFRIGSRDTFRGASIYYARSSRSNATFAVPSRQVQNLLDLF